LALVVMAVSRLLLQVMVAIQYFRQLLQQAAATAVEKQTA